MHVHRRAFLQMAGMASTASAAGVASGFAAKRPRILLRSSWQTVNIGDIAHTPGVLRLLNKHIPEADMARAEAALRRSLARLKVAEKRRRRAVR